MNYVDAGRQTVDVGVYRPSFDGGVDVVQAAHRVFEWVVTSLEITQPRERARARKRERTRMSKLIPRSKI